MLPHADALLRTALRFTGGESAAAEDAVQETFLRAWRGRAQFEPGTNARAWLLRILVNFLRKRWHQSARQPAVVSLDEHAERHEIAAPARAASSPADSDVFAALETLPADQRSVLVLNVVEGFACREIAAMLEVPIGTVMSRLGRARATLRDLLQPPVSSGPHP